MRGFHRDLLAKGKLSSVPVLPMRVLEAKRRTLESRGIQSDLALVYCPYSISGKMQRLS